MCFSKCRLNENPPIVGRKKQTKPLLKTHSYTHRETHTYTLMTRKGVGGFAVISHRSACPVSLAGDSLLQTLNKYTCYSFPTRQRRLARPDKAIYPSPAQPVQTLSLMFSLLQEINMFGSRQTTRLCQAGSSRLAGHHWGP